MSVATATLNSWKGWDLSREPNLSGADLREADLSGANLTGADLSRARLTHKQLEPATGDENTRLPPGLGLRALGREAQDEQPEEG
jgi:uncharacterized protein YjbI with pentapeptide repeats